MLQNVKVSVFTSSELIRENQQGDGGRELSPTQIRVTNQVYTLLLISEESLVSVTLNIDSSREQKNKLQNYFS